MSSMPDQCAMTKSNLVSPTFSAIEPELKQDTLARHFSSTATDASKKKKVPPSL